MGSIKHLEEINALLPKISHYIALNPPGSKPEEAKRHLQAAMGFLQKDDTEKALEYVKKALVAALPDRYFLLNSALKLRKDGEKLLRAHNFEEAIFKFDESIEKYKQALVVLQTINEEDKNTATKVLNALSTAENLKKIANFRRIYKGIKDAKTEAELWNAIRELEQIEVPMEDDRVDALITAHRKVILMQLQAIADMMAEAREMYSREEWYSAMKTLESAKRALNNLKTLAKKYDLVEEIGMINELLKACENNIYGIRELLETGEMPPGWHLKVPDKQSFVIKEEATEEEFFDLSVKFETRLEQIREKYIISGLIGEGAFSYVYRAKNRKGMEVALKVLKYLDDKYMSSFIREWDAARNLEHENIVKVYKADPRLGFLEMELATGNLEEDIRKPLDPKLAGRIVFEVGRALHYAHSHGILHRDVKPSNILMFGSPEKVKLGDWGLARLTSKATRKSSLVRHKTLLYSSPEQIENPENVDARSDIFQLGVVFYELLTGEHPFQEEYEAAIVRKILEHNPEPPSYYNPAAKPFDRIVLKMLEKDPNRRYQTVRELQNDLKDVLIKMGVQVKESIGSRERISVVAENAYLRLKTIVDGIAMDMNLELSKLINDLEYLYTETANPELKQLIEQITLMADEGTKPTEYTMKELERILKRWVWV